MEASRSVYGSSPARRAATTASSRVCAPSFRIAERRYPFTVSGRRPNACGRHSVGRARRHTGEDIDLARRQQHLTGVCLLRPGRRGQPRAHREQLLAQRRVGHLGSERTQFAVRLADVLPGPRSGRGVRHLVPGDGQELLHLVPYDKGLFHVAGRRDCRVERTVPEGERLTQRPVQHAPYPPAHDDGHRDHRAQALRGDRGVVLVADVPRRRVVGHRARPRQGDRLAAEPAVGRYDEPAQRGGLRPVEFHDPGVARVREQSAERDGQSARPAQPQQRRLHLDRIDRFRHAVASPPRSLYPRSGVVRPGSLFS